ncbi:MAG: FAD-dependent thymidylate synthase [Deltaproteobacteria bacterium]|nr:FAD-dependent thymidylate synthase [Deltaproteobacteria bacterium]
MESLRTFKDIEVKLVGAIEQPYEVAVASARTCYSGKGIIFPTDVSSNEKMVALRDKIASSTMEAGHLTTRQHAHFVFALSGVSRQFIWSFLHSHPFYNSEQVSQRYVKVKPGNFLTPPLEGRALEIYQETIGAQTADYENLIRVLKNPIATEYYDRFKSRKKYADKWDGSVDKRCYEVARYVLGIGTTAYLYHTVSALTLLRYAKLCDLFETPEEQKHVIRKMLDCVKAVDPLFEKEIPDPLPLDKTVEYELLTQFKKSSQNSRESFIREFDERLEGKTSKLINYTMGAEELLANAFRTTAGLIRSEMSDEKALELLLDPKYNAMLADTLNSGTVEKISQLFHHVHFTFQKKISHTADSQDQRHRAVLASRPILMCHYRGKPDYITPYGINHYPEALELYTRSMERTFESVNQLLDLGVKEEYAYYLLPNALSIRMVSTGDLHGYQHKWKMRSCYNAQEEIFRATIDEITQVKSLFPKIAQHLKAPCYLRQRAGVTPYCPEGDRYCGLPVWKYEIDQYHRKSI